VSGFRPNIRFFADHSKLTVSLAAAAATATVMIAGAPGASAATVAGGSPSHESTLSVANLKAGVAKASNPTPKPGKPKPGKPKPAKPKPAKPKAASNGAKATAVPQDFTFYDSISPSLIPANQQIATYADGKYAVERSLVSNPDQVIWIDVNGRDANADCIDVEPGDATPARAATWVQHRLTAHPGSIAIIYTMRSEWGATKAAVAKLPASMQSQVRWWIADPTGHPHLVPGSQATQWYWGDDYDISMAEPGF
jgi:hypothetical protein